MKINLFPQAPSPFPSFWAQSRNWRNRIISFVENSLKADKEQNKNGTLCLHRQKYDRQKKLSMKFFYIQIKQFACLKGPNKTSQILIFLKWSIKLSNIKLLIKQYSGRRLKGSQLMGSNVARLNSTKLDFYT